MASLRGEIADSLATGDLVTGWTPAYSLDPQTRRDRRLPDLLRAHHRRATAQRGVVLDRELAL